MSFTVFFVLFSQNYTLSDSVATATWKLSNAYLQFPCLFTVYWLFLMQTNVDKFLAESNISPTLRTHANSKVWLVAWVWVVVAKLVEFSDKLLTQLRSREYMFTHMNHSTVDIPFLSEALSGERIWVILKVANLMRKVWWLWQEEKEMKEKKLDWRIA
jgi:hypothetical protein